MLLSHPVCSCIDLLGWTWSRDNLLTDVLTLTLFPLCRSLQKYAEVAYRWCHMHALYILGHYTYLTLFPTCCSVFWITSPPCLSSSGGWQLPTRWFESTTEDAHWHAVHPVLPPGSHLPLRLWEGKGGGGWLLCCITCLSHVYHVYVTLRMSRSHVRWWCSDCWTRSWQLSSSLPQSSPRCYHMSSDTGWRWMRFYYSMSRWDVSMRTEGIALFQASASCL